jgi:hypothetical protein
MGTKAQAVEALKALCSEAVLIDDSDWDGYSVQLEAPHGHHWGGSIHCYSCGFWFKSNPKPTYWDMVIEVIGQIEPPTPCTVTDCEGMIAGNECEYW